MLDAHLEEVRSGHAEEPAARARAAARAAPVRWDERIDELGRRYHDAVLSWVGPRRLPARRCGCRSRLDRGGPAGSRIDGEPAGLPLAEGRACLTAHGHDPDFTWQENFQVRGDLVRDDDGWALVPRRLVGGFELPNEGALGPLPRATSASRCASTARHARAAGAGAGRG